MYILNTISFFLATASAAALNSRTLASNQICSEIASQINGTVYSSILQPNFYNDIQHYMTSSTQTPMCVVEPKTNADMSTILKLVGSSRTPFAVKSGGHASNPGFSSTTGVHISLAQFKQINLSADKSTVEIGLGNLWSDVYSALNGSGVNVIGGRVTGPGTGGFTLGGGYSWKTNQYGLTCDTTISYNLILPNGTFTVVDESKPDLFFALKGGLNRFGIVTSIVYKTFPQTDLVYGGYRLYGASDIPALINATETFHKTNTDPKAQIITTINGGILPEAVLIIFYDAPTAPAIFGVFDNIGTPLINTVGQQTYAAFVAGTPDEAEAGNRGAFASLSTTDLTVKFMDAIYNETQYYGALSILHSGSFLSYDIEPFMNYGQYATDSAYPHTQSGLPLNLYFAWSDSSQDAYWRGIMQQSVDHLISVARAEGIYSDSIPAYPNYALSTYTGSQIYGATNAARLRTIQSQYDPNGVMLLAGGFTI